MLTSFWFTKKLHSILTELWPLNSWKFDIISVYSRHSLVWLSYMWRQEKQVWRRDIDVGKLQHFSSFQDSEIDFGVLNVGKWVWEFQKCNQSRCESDGSSKC